MNNKIQEIKGGLLTTQENIDKIYISKKLVREKIEKAKMISNSPQVSLSPKAHNQLLDIILSELKIIDKTSSTDGGKKDG